MSTYACQGCKREVSTVFELKGEWYCADCFSHLAWKDAR